MTAARTHEQALRRETPIMSAPEYYCFTDPDDDIVEASMLSGRPVIELTADTVWLSADNAEALAAWLIEAAKALRERSKP